MSYIDARQTNEMYILGRLSEFTNANNIQLSYSSDLISGLRIHMTRKWAQFMSEIDSMSLVSAVELDDVINSIIEEAKKQLRIKEESDDNN